MWIQTGQMQEITDRAICSDQAVPMIVVMPDAWDTWYINQSDGKVPYEEMFFEELIPHIEKTYRARSNKEFRAIAGLSMGGYGSDVYKRQGKNCNHRGNDSSLSYGHDLRLHYKTENHRLS